MHKDRALSPYPLTLGYLPAPEVPKTVGNTELTALTYLEIVFITKLCM